MTLKSALLSLKWFICCETCFCALSKLYWILWYLKKLKVAVILLFTCLNFLNSNFTSSSFSGEGKLQQKFALPKMDFFKWKTPYIWPYLVGCTAFRIPTVLPNRRFRQKTSFLGQNWTLKKFWIASRIASRRSRDLADHKKRFRPKTQTDPRGPVRAWKNPKKPTS